MTAHKFNHFNPWEGWKGNPFLWEKQIQLLTAPMNGACPSKPNDAWQQEKPERWNKRENERRMAGHQTLCFVFTMDDCCCYVRKQVETQKWDPVFRGFPLPPFGNGTLITRRAANSNYTLLTSMCPNNHFSQFFFHYLVIVRIYPINYIVQVQIVKLIFVGASSRSWCPI